MSLFKVLLSLVCSRRAFTVAVRRAFGVMKYLALRRLPHITRKILECPRLSKLLKQLNLNIFKILTNTQSLFIKKMFIKNNATSIWLVLSAHLMQEDNRDRDKL